MDIDLVGIKGRSRGKYNEYILYEIAKGLVKLCFKFTIVLDQGSPFWPLCSDSLERKG